MEFGDAVKYLRKELGISQNELASALHINYATVGRWELGRNVPNRSITVALMEYAVSESASERCIDALRGAISKAAKGKLDTADNGGTKFPDFVAGESAEQLISVFENINGGVSVVAYEGVKHVRLAYANRKYYELFGYTKEQFMSELSAPHDTIHPDDTDFVRETITKVKTTLKPATFRYRIIKRDGSIAYISCNSSVSPIKGLGDTVLISLLTDVTEAALAENSALVSGERLDAIMHNIDSAVTAAVTNDDGSVNILFSNDLYNGILGFTKEQYDNEVTDPFLLIHPDDAAELKKAVLGLHKIGDERTLRYRVVCRDKTVKWINAKISVMSFPDTDKPVQLSVYTDITAAVEASEQLIAQRDKIKGIMDTTPSGLAVIELDRNDIAGSLRVTEYNERFFSITGYGIDEYRELINNDPLRYLRREDIPSIVSEAETICDGDIGTSGDCTVHYNTKSGRVLCLYFTGILVEKHGSKCVVHICVVDITARKEAIDKQRISEEMFRIAAEIDKRAVVIFDVKKNTCRVECSSLFSSERGETFDNIPQSLIERGVTAPGYEDVLRDLFTRIRNGEREIHISLQMHSGENKYDWFECNSTTVFDSEGQPDQAVLVFHNITEQRIKEAVFRKWQQSIEKRPPESYTLFRCNLSKDASLDEQDGELLRVRYAAEPVSFNSRTKAYADEFVCPDDREAYVSLLDSDTLLAMYYRGEHSAVLDYREISGNGELMWRRLTVEMVEYLNSTDVQAFLMYEDIDEAKKAEIEAKELAESDPLTGALNRVAFADKVDAIIRSAPSEQNALVMFDMDGFKQINDSFGHAAGDRALQDVVSVLRSFIGSGDLVCRLGGDEFMVWMRDVPYDAVIGKTVLQICNHIHKAYSHEVLLSASAGIAVYPRDGSDYDELYHNADKALYKVKQSEKGRFEFYSSTDEQYTKELEDALSAVRQAPQSPRGTKHRLLIVDDSETNRMLLKVIFKDDYLIETARSGEKAMLRLRHFGTAISVVLLDLVMPGMNGFEVLKKIQSNVDLRAIPVIIVSGDEEHSTLLKAMELGAAEYVTKPVDVDIVRMRVRSVISKADNERLRAQNSYLMLQRDEEVKYRTVLESTGTVVVEYDWRNHVFIYDNNISEYIAGNYDHRGIWQVFLSDMIAESADVKSMQDMLLSLGDTRGETHKNTLVRLKTPGGTRHWFRVNIYKTLDEFNLPDKMILTFNDVHDEVLANDKLTFQATRDALTGLYNRTAFFDKAAEMIAAKEPGYYVMSCIDIEKFKVINDQYGTEAGDRVLKHFAKVLGRLHQGKNGICGRIMADNFAVLYPVSLIGSAVLAESHRTLSRINGMPVIRFYASRCVIDDKELDVSSAYDRASIAKDTIKGRYDTYIATYDDSMRDSIIHEQTIITEMSDALKNGEFEPWFQPQYNHATGAVIGAEALVRWHKDGKFIPPAEFIPVFERNGFIYELDKYIWEQVCVMLRDMMAAGNPLPVSVNISRVDLYRDSVVDFITGLTEKYAIPVDLLKLEVTESAFSDAGGEVTKKVEELIARGFTVEIDDFGSGYSSLNTLKDVPASVLKLDMRFFDNTKYTQRSGNIIESVVRMARWLGMAVIAEGVEVIEQADYLKSIGCYYIQGYLYSKPVPLDKYLMLIKETGTEPNLTRVRTLKTWNNSNFWDPASLETMVFNSYVGGACIFELSNGKAEILRMNDSYIAQFGGMIPEGAGLAGSHIEKYLDIEGRKKLSSTIHSAIDTHTEASCEITPVDGTHVEYVLMTVRVIAETHERTLFYCVAQNLTGQREAERRQLESAARLDVIMGNINGGVSALIVNEDGTSRSVFTNERYYELYGYTRKQAEAEKLDVMTLIEPDDMPIVMAKLVSLKRYRQPTVIDYSIRKPDGKRALLRANSSLLHISGYEDDVVASVIVDITEVKVLEEQLGAVMDNIGNGIAASVVRDGKITYLFANDRYYELLGYTKKEYTSHFSGSFDAIHPDDRERTNAVIRQATIDGKPYSVDFRVIRRDGEIRWVACKINIIRLPDIDEPVHLASVTDITKEREASERLSYVNDSAHEILAHADTEKAIAETLERLRSYHNADRAYVVELDYDKMLSYNTYEVCADGIEPQADKLTGVPFGCTDYWYESLSHDRFFVIDSVDKLPDEQSELREMLRGQDIQSLIIAPLYIGGRLAGFAGGDNIRTHRDTSERLDALVDYISVLLSRRDDSRRKDSDRQTITDLMSNMPGGFVRMKITENGKTVPEYFNKGFLELTGMSIDELMSLYGGGNLTGVHPDDIVSLTDYRDKLMKDGSGGTVRCRIKNSRCEYLWVNIYGRITKTDSGETFITEYFTDATEQAAEEQKQKELLDNLPCGAALYEYDGSYLTVIHRNKRYWTMVGRTPEDLDKESVLNTIHPDDRPTVRRELDAAIRANRAFSTDFRVQNDSGEYKPFHVYATLEKTSDGINRFYSTYTPITEQTMSIQEMLPVALSAVMSATDNYSFIKSIDGTYICCSNSSATLLGYESPRDAVGKTDREMFGGTVAEAFAAEDSKIVESGQPLLNSSRLIPFGEKLVTVSYSKYPIKDASGKVIGLYGIGHDITEQKKKESQLELLAASIPGGIAIFTVRSIDDITLDYFNEGFRNITGWAPETFERYRKNPVSLVYADDLELVISHAKDFIYQNKPMNCAFRINAGAGRLKWVSFRATVIDRLPDRLLTNCVVTDITDQQEEKERLRQSEEEYRIATSHSGRIICRYLITENTLAFPDELVKKKIAPQYSYGIPERAVKEGIVSPDTVNDYVGFYRRIEQGEKECTVIFKKRFPSGWRWVDARSTTIFDDNGKPVSAVISYSDITEEQEKEAVYRKWQQGLSDRNPEQYTLYRTNLTKPDNNEIVEGTLLDFDPNTFSSFSFDERVAAFAERCVCEEDRARYLSFMNGDAMLANYYRGKRSASIEFRANTAKDSSAWLRLSVDLVEYPNSSDVEAYMMFENVTHEIQTRIDAETDPLTGLLNRKAFEEKINSALARRAPDSLCALFLLDMDGFKLINDSFGHSVGDKVLIGAGKAIRSVLRESDFVCRMGGDEFLVFLSSMPNREAVSEKARQLIRLTHQSFTLDVRVSVSIGLSLCPSDGNTFDELYKKADKALYYVKDHGKDNFVFYGDEVVHAVKREMPEEESRLRRRMLIVDDSETHCLVLKNIFNEKFTIDTVHSGSEALTYVRRNRAGLSCILLDLMMPGMDGFAVLEKLRASEGAETIPVVVVSGMDDRETNLRAIRAGASDFVTKPVDAELLQIRVASAVSKAENERLRIHNSYLALQSNELRNCRTALETEKTSVAEYRVSDGSYSYDSGIAMLLEGSFDSRSLPDILAQDNILIDTEPLKQLVESGSGEINVRLKAVGGEVHMFRIRAVSGSDAMLLIIVTDTGAEG